MSSFLGNINDITYLEMICMKQKFLLEDSLKTEKIDLPMETNLNENEILMRDPDCFSMLMSPPADLTFPNIFRKYIVTENTRRFKRIVQVEPKVRQKLNLYVKSPLPSPNQKKNRSKRKTSGNVQMICCVEKCSNEVKNRRCESLKTVHEFKSMYIKKKWTKICNYCYFSSLYMFNKSK